MRPWAPENGKAMGRPSWRSSFLVAPDAEFFCGKLGIGTKKEKGAKKKETEALWKLTPLMEIRSQRGFPQRLGKHKTLSTVPTRLITRFIFSHLRELIHQEGGAK